MANSVDQDLQILAQTITNENVIISQRLIWGLTLQGFLFASYFFTGSEQAERVKFVLPLLGCAVAFSSFIGSLIAHIAIVRAISAFETIQSAAGRDRSVHPGTKFPFIFTLLNPHFFIPASLATVWAYVFLSNHLPVM